MRPCIPLPLLAIALMIGCDHSMVSPCGNFEAQVRSAPSADGSPRQVVSITDQTGQVVYRDLKSSFVVHLRVYSSWDANSRFWLYSSDSGRFFVWELENGSWTKSLWIDSPTRIAAMDGEQGDADRIWYQDAAANRVQLFVRTPVGWTASADISGPDAAAFAPPTGLKPKSHS